MKCLLTAAAPIVYQGRCGKNLEGKAEAQPDVAAQLIEIRLSVLTVQRNAVRIEQCFPVVRVLVKAVRRSAEVERYASGRLKRGKLTGVNLLVVCRHGALIEQVGERCREADSLGLAHLEILADVKIALDEPGGSPSGHAVYSEGAGGRILRNVRPLTALGIHSKVITRNHAIADVDIAAHWRTLIQVLEQSEVRGHLSVPKSSLGIAFKRIGAVCWKISG